MDDTVKKVIVDVLDIIGYQDDKEKFAQDFIATSTHQAMLNLIEELPVNEREVLTGDKNEPENVKKLFEDNFSEEQRVEALKKTIAENFNNYLETIIPTLDTQKNDRLRAYFQI